MGLALRVHRTAPSETEQSLVAAVRRGDDSAFEELFSRYRERISGYVHGAVGDHARAEDITQEVFISALRRMRNTERPIAFKPWIYEIAKNACIDEFRRSRRASEVPLSEDGGTPSVELQLPSPDPPPDVVVEERQRLRNLRGAFGGLSENHHRILVMRELEGLSYGEIGTRLGMSRAMVESTLFRARKRLNHEFRELESGQRCERVRSAIDRSELRSVRMLGVRERRQLARHMAYCKPCRQYAWMAGFDASSLKRRSAGQRIAALLPIGWWTRSGGINHVVREPSWVATRAGGRIARYSDPLSQVGLGRAVAAAAAIAVAAGGGYVAGAPSAQRPVSATKATKAAVVTLAPAPARGPRASQYLIFRRPPVARGAVTHGIAATRGVGHSGHGAQASHSGNGAAGGRTGGSKPASPHGAATAAASPSAGPAAGGATSPSPAHGGGRAVVGRILGGGSSSSGPRLPAVSLPSLPSIPAPTVNAPAHLPQPAQGAASAATQAASAASQAANAATQAVNNTTHTIGSVGGNVPKLLGGAGSGSGGG